MPETPDCLASLVGLSQGSDCFPLPADPDAADRATASLTGRYIDQVEGLRLRPGGTATAATDLYDRLAKARDSAAFQVRAALEAGRSASYGIPLFKQRGTFGGLGNGQLMPLGTRAVMTFYTNARREGAWRITGMRLFTDQAVTDVPVLLDGEEVGQITTNAASGAGLLDVLIPLDGNQHTLEAILPEGVRVKSNTFFSGCFGCQAGTPWALTVRNNLQNITATTPGNGFSISVVEECTADPDLLCYAIGKDEGQPLFRYPDLVRFIALAIQYKAAELFTTDLLGSAQLSRYTSLEPKALAELRDYYASKLTQASADGTGNYLKWLLSPDGLGQVQHPCYLGPPRAQAGKVWTL
jgi:hypothetical protein